MQQGIQAIEATYERIHQALLAWNWADAEAVFDAFCAAHNVPDWFADESLFSGMKLWAAGRPTQLLRHFAAFFERALGQKLSLPAEEVTAMRVAASLM